MDGSAENWRQFQGTELGGLLSSIYGGARRGMVKYPVLKKSTAEFDPAAAKFRPVNSTLQTTDPTKATRRSVRVAVPRPSGGESKENLSLQVSSLPTRRSEEVIRAELDEITMRQRAYRPAYHAPKGEEEKERLAQICMYKGGKGLPVVLPVGETPMELAARNAQQKKNDVFVQQRRLARGDERASAAAMQVLRSPRMSVEERMAQQISREIDERCAHLEEMRDIGISKAEEKAIIADINARAAELGGLRIDRR